MSIYFAGDIIRYPDNFYLTYKDYPGFIVAIPGNHDCQPDDPPDGPGDPNKVPLDGWVQNFMSTIPASRFTEHGRGSHADGFALCLLDVYDAVRDDHRPVFQRRRRPRQKFIPIRLRGFKAS